jgi:sec-independent protein translocase protein TatA
MIGLDNPIHIAFLLVLLLLVFGAKRLPEMGKSLGSGLRGFKESLSGETTETESSPPTPSLNAAPAPPASEPEEVHEVVSSAGRPS